MACPTPTAGPSSPSREMSAGPASTVSALDLVTAAGLRLPAVLGALGSDPSGLDDAEAGRRLGQVGPNVLAERRVTRGAQRRARLRERAPLRARRRRPARRSPPGGRRVARPPSAAGDGGGARSRRRGRRGRGRHRARRHPLAVGDAAGVRRGRADRRVAPGGQGRRAGHHGDGRADLGSCLSMAPSCTRAPVAGWWWPPDWHRVRSHPSGSASTRPRPPSRSGSSGSRSCWSWWPAC